MGTQFELRVCLGHKVWHIFKSLSCPKSVIVAFHFAFGYKKVLQCQMFEISCTFILIYFAFHIRVSIELIPYYVFIDQNIVDFSHRILQKKLRS